LGKLFFGSLEIVKLLIEIGNLQKENMLRSEMKDNDNETALYWASRFGYLEIVKLLIKEGNLPLRIKEDIMMKDNNGHSAYSVARTHSIKQLFDNILFNEDINDIIKDIQQANTLLLQITNIYIIQINIENKNHSIIYHSI